MTPERERDTPVFFSFQFSFQYKQILVFFFFFLQKYHIFFSGPHVWGISIISVQLRVTKASLVCFHYNFGYKVIHNLLLFLVPPICQIC